MAGHLTGQLFCSEDRYRRTDGGVGWPVRLALSLCAAGWGLPPTMATAVGLMAAVAALAVHFPPVAPPGSIPWWRYVVNSGNSWRKARQLEYRGLRRT